MHARSSSPIGSTIIISMQRGETEALNIALATIATRLDTKSLALCTLLGYAKLVVGTDGQ